jgi:hypothetical protein
MSCHVQQARSHTHSKTSHLNMHVNTAPHHHIHPWDSLHYCPAHSSLFLYLIMKACMHLHKFSWRRLQTASPLNFGFFFCSNQIPWWDESSPLSIITVQLFSLRWAFLGASFCCWAPTRTLFLPLRTNNVDHAARHWLNSWRGNATTASNPIQLFDAPPCGSAWCQLTVLFSTADARSALKR